MDHFKPIFPEQSFTKGRVCIGLADLTDNILEKFQRGFKKNHRTETVPVNDAGKVSVLVVRHY